MTTLYLEASAEVNKLAVQVERLKYQNSVTTSACNRKVAALKRITSTQIGDMSRSLDSVTASCDTLRRKSDALAISCDTLREKNAKLTERLDAVQKTNLIYKQKIESSTDEIESKEVIIAGLQKELRETVTASSKVESRSSNLGEENKRLKSEIRAYKNALRSFQAAYINVYASALGVNPDYVSFSDTTSVSELQKMISSATNTANIPLTSMVEPMYIDDETDDLITL